MKNFVSVDWLYENINNENVKAFDVRSDLFEKEYGKRVFEEGHIKNARFIDVEKHLSGPKGKHGGRHPLPNLEEFAETVRSFGIGSDTIVIAYDEQKIASAARFCFMLRLIGHEKNFILNGGIKRWIDKGYPLEKGRATINMRFYPIFPEFHLELADVNDVRAAIGKEDTAIVDSRMPDRYRGLMSLLTLRKVIFLRCKLLERKLE